MNPRPRPGGFSGNLRHAAVGGSLGAPVTLRPGSDPETVWNQLADIEGVSVEPYVYSRPHWPGSCVPGLRGASRRIFRPAWPRGRRLSAAAGSVSGVTADQTGYCRGVAPAPPTSCAPLRAAMTGARSPRFGASMVTTTILVIRVLFRDFPALAFRSQ